MIDVLYIIPYRYRFIFVLLFLDSATFPCCLRFGHSALQPRSLIFLIFLKIYYFYLQKTYRLIYQLNLIWASVSQNDPQDSPDGEPLSGHFLSNIEFHCNHIILSNSIYFSFIIISCIIITIQKFWLRQLGFINSYTCCTNALWGIQATVLYTFL